MGICLSVFAKPPIPGACKSRLAATVGNEAAASLHRAMLLDTLGALERAGADRLVVLAAPEQDGVAVLRELVPDPWEIVVQEGDDFGTRLERGMAALTATGDSAIITDSDSPTMPIEPLNAALAHLREQRRALLGRTVDGGYYLLGLSDHAPDAFADISWSTEVVAAQTRARLDRLGYATLELPTTRDVDVADDLLWMQTTLAAEPHLAPRTAAWIADRP